ncbi:hypothetical protein [Fusibacter sp. JL216-2]|uniref:hypothetical protein n=1 Tax=Fusibacter sp. JL216-2 TaxID=3071453 RepID=UPI003D34F8AF
MFKKLSKKIMDHYEAKATCDCSKRPVEDELEKERASKEYEKCCQSTSQSGV